jgi:hypothetical protein
MWGEFRGERDTGAHQRKQGPEKRSGILSSDWKNKNLFKIINKFGIFFNEHRSLEYIDLCTLKHFDLSWLD